MGHQSGVISKIGFASNGRFEASRADAVEGLCPRTWFIACIEANSALMIRLARIFQRMILFARSRIGSLIGAIWIF
jgi:hypothetical protein